MLFLASSMDLPKQIEVTVLELRVKMAQNRAFPPAV